MATTDDLTLTEVETIKLLVDSDEKMARVCEDAILELLRSGYLQRRNLPADAREVLETRRKLREHLDALRNK